MDQDSPTSVELPGGVGRLVLVDPDTPPKDSPRPYLHPLRTPAGRVISDLRPADHDWHLGLSLAVSNITIGEDELDTNLWGGPTWLTGTGYRQVDNNGSQRPEGADPGDLALGWFDARGRRFLDERRRLSVRRLGDVTVLRIESRWRALGERLVFGSPTTAGRPDAGYGGLFLRLDPSFEGSVVSGPDGAVAEPMGMVSRWLAVADGSATVALRADEGSPVDPSTWFVRTSGTPMLCAAPFFGATWTLDAGAEASWSWQVLLADRVLGAEEIEASWGQGG
jgi:hypothetical protein